MKARLPITLLGLLIACGGEPARAQHAGDILVGRTASMRLIATGIPDRTRFLAPVSSGPFHGWSGTSLGFDAVISPDPLDDVLPLAPGASIHLEVVSMDPELSLRSFTAPGYYRVTLEGQGTLVDGNQPVSTRADFFFEVIGASPSLGLIRSAENLSLTLNTEDGVQYRLQSSSALGSAWTDVGGAFIGTGRTKSITLPQDAPAAFFRVLVGN